MEHQFKEIKLNYEEQRKLLVSLVSLTNEKIRGSIKLLVQKNHSIIIENYLLTEKLLQESHGEDNVNDLLMNEISFSVHKMDMEKLLTDASGNDIIFHSNADLLIIEKYLC